MPWQSVVDCCLTLPNLETCSPLKILPFSNVQVPILPNSSKQLLVLKAYPELLKRVFTLVKTRIRHGHDGVLLTGQSGIGEWTWIAQVSATSKPLSAGKTYWIYYLLASLLQRNEAPILLAGLNQLILFYDGSAYIPSSEMAPSMIENIGLPVSENPQHCIWSLIDWDKATPPSISTSSNLPLFIVHAASSIEVRYKRWIKDSSGIKWIMPHWSQEELISA